MVGLGWLGWTAWFHSTPAVTSELITFEVTSDYEVAARLDVQLDDGVDASCRLRALAEDHTAVGELEFSPVAGANEVVDPHRAAGHERGEARLHRTRPAAPALTLGLRFRARLANLIVLPVRVRWPMSAAPTPIGRMTPTDPVRGC